MISSINFLFLLSLGILSWFILCYIQQIEQILKVDSNKAQELPKEFQSMTTAQTNPQMVKIVDTNHDNYDLYINFLGIFVCIYALAKITHIAEMYMAKRIRHKIYIPTIHQTELEDSETLSDLREQQENLKWKINQMEKQSRELKLKLKKVVENQTPVPVQGELEEKIHNIFINHRHIHLNRQIYVNQGGTVNMEFGKEKKEPCSIWDKYMELKNSTSEKSNGNLLSHMPVVMSSEELDNIKAIF
ncbi:uncharacterized protein LOC135955263 isoform X2 [Calliphora vicina]|uniref:uncharacterized protein LOC135955263 isoform X2 n=1 Tax=Calliphora vicina TaxID=7373 RepID=UPI00325ADD8C